MSALQPDDRSLFPHHNSSATPAPSRSSTPRPPALGGAQVPVTKGKLTIRIAEARGLKQYTKPYLVVVFQRNELITPGSRTALDEEDGDLATPGVGTGIPMQRQGSDSGRPAMAIPMRSRQSSNTSANDSSALRRAAPSDLMLDAEAVL